MIKNITKNKIIVKNHVVCKSIWSKARGLMFSRSKKDFGMVFLFDKEKKYSLHMCFVFYPIDVLFLDKDMKVVEKKENFLPFTFFFPKKKASTIIELPDGSGKEIKISDKIRIS